MRISDWSSDVCSSDLVGQQIRYVRRVDIDPRRHCALASDAVPVVEQALQPFATDGVAEDRPTPVEGLSRPRGFTARVRTVNRFRADRKSVVSGKSVSVRVDLGGRRLITKKNKY